MKPEVLAFIPARGGSKGIPRKNIRLVNGAPLIAYTIDVALRCRNITRVVVSTDDHEIAAVARDYGAQVPFLRPKAYSDDNTPVGAAQDHALKTFRKQGYVPDYIATMYPTSLFRTTSLIEHLVDMGLKHNCRVIAAKRINPNGWDSLLRQGDTLTPHRVSNTLASVTAHRSYGIFSGISSSNNSAIYVHELNDPSYFIDIDTPEDLQLAEEVLRRGMFPIDTPVPGAIREQVSV